MMMTSAQVITHALLSSKSVFIGFTLTQNLSFPYMFHRRVTTIFHYVLIGEQTQTFVLITTVFGFAIGNHFSWAWRFGWRHVAKQRGKWKIVRLKIVWYDVPHDSISSLICAVLEISDICDTRTTNLLQPYSEI